MVTTDVFLKVPADRTSCAAWLKKQDPSIVADALSLCEAGRAAERQKEDAAIAAPGGGCAAR